MGLLLRCVFFFAISTLGRGFNLPPPLFFTATPPISRSHPYCDRLRLRGDRIGPRPQRKTRHRNARIASRSRSGTASRSPPAPPPPPGPLPSPNPARAACRNASPALGRSSPGQQQQAQQQQQQQQPQKFRGTGQRVTPWSASSTAPSSMRTQASVVSASPGPALGAGARPRAWSGGQHAGPAAEAVARAVPRFAAARRTRARSAGERERVAEEYPG